MLSLPPTVVSLKGGCKHQIRGGAYLSASNEQLIDIDGLPRTQGHIGSLNPLSLETENIDSMTILKDASATAIFGNRASNGVVLITTKRRARRASRS